MTVVAAITLGIQDIPMAATVVVEMVAVEAVFVNINI